MIRDTRRSEAFISQFCEEVSLLLIVEAGHLTLVCGKRQVLGDFGSYTIAA